MLICVSLILLRTLARRVGKFWIRVRHDVQTHPVVAVIFEVELIQKVVLVEVHHLLQDLALVISLRALLPMLRSLLLRLCAYFARCLRAICRLYVLLRVDPH